MVFSLLSSCKQRQFFEQFLFLFCLFFFNTTNIAFLFFSYMEQEVFKVYWTIEEVNDHTPLQRNLFSWRGTTFHVYVDEMKSETKWRENNENRSYSFGNVFRLTKKIVSVEDYGWRLRYSLPEYGWNLVAVKASTWKAVKSVRKNIELTFFLNSSFKTAGVPQREMEKKHNFINDKVLQFSRSVLFSRSLLFCFFAKNL